MSKRDADNGFKIRFHFCPNCGSATEQYRLPERAGSNVFWEGDRNLSIYGIAVGSFADPNFPRPTSSAWEEVMHPWLGLTTATCRPGRQASRAHPRGKPGFLTYELPVPLAEDKSREGQTGSFG